MKMTRPLSWMVWMLVLGLLLVAFRVFPADVKKYELSEVQKLRLQVKQKDVLLTQQASAIAQQNFQQTLAAYNAEVKTIEKENKWPETLQFDPNTLEFKEPPPAAPEPAKK